MSTPTKKFRASMIVETSAFSVNFVADEVNTSESLAEAFRSAKARELRAFRLGTAFFEPQKITAIVFEEVPEEPSTKKRGTK